jgi:hypothetical protein
VTYWCPECDIYWWPFQAKQFGGACPKCRRGTKPRQEPGSMEAEAEYKVALAAKEARDAAQARRLAFDEYWAAWCHNDAIEFEVSVQQDLARLPVLGEEAA